jgi:hypothetical protein
VKAATIDVPDVVREQALAVGAGSWLEAIPLLVSVGSRSGRADPLKDLAGRQRPLSTQGCAERSRMSLDGYGER